MQDKRQEWAERHLEIFELPSYSPELNLIEILWRFIKYEWLDVKAYQGWAAIVNSKILGAETLDTSFRSSSIDGP